MRIKLNVETNVPPNMAPFIASNEYLANMIRSTTKSKFMEKADRINGNAILKMLGMELLIKWLF